MAIPSGKKIARSFFSNSDTWAMMMALTFYENKLIGDYFMVFAIESNKMLNAHVPHI